MFEFEITKKSKRIARKRRQKNEKKWRIFRILSTIFGIAWLPSILIAVFVIPDEDYVMLLLFITIYAISLISYVVVNSILANLTSHWIQDRLNEKIWIENDTLYHFVQTAFAAGWNIRHADSSASVYQYNLLSIKNPKYDPNSGRIEFDVDGKVIVYRNYIKGVIELESLFNGAPAVFYEYMEPSLYTYLANNGVKFSLETLDFKIRDQHI